VTGVLLYHKEIADKKSGMNSGENILSLSEKIKKK